MFLFVNMAADVIFNAFAAHVEEKTILTVKCQIVIYFFVNNYFYLSPLHYCVLIHFAPCDISQQHMYV